MPIIDEAVIMPIIEDSVTVFGWQNAHAATPTLDRAHQSPALVRGGTAAQTRGRAPHRCRVRAPASPGDSKNPESGFRQRHSGQATASSSGKPRG